MRYLFFILLLLPASQLFAQELTHSSPFLTNIVHDIIVTVDVVGISILLMGFVKGCVVFVKKEIDIIRKKDAHDEIFQLRQILGTYIILSLDFLIVSDIIHSVVEPELDKLVNLGIIVILRTSIGFFLGRELQEMKHEEAKLAAQKRKGDVSDEH